MNGISGDPSGLGLLANPDFGSSFARRIIHLETQDRTTVVGHLVDNYHEMRCRLRHDGRSVTGIDGEMLRFPTTCCPGSPVALGELIGVDLATSMFDLYEPRRVRRNCTHLFDLVAFAMAHARRAARPRIYVATVPDETITPVDIEVLCDGVTVHRWTARDGHIVAPSELAGRPLLRGFGKWSAAAFAGEALEAATLLSRTCTLAKIRPFRPESGAGRPLVQASRLAGACFAYAHDRIGSGTFIGVPSATPMETDASDKAGRPS